MTTILGGAAFAVLIAAQFFSVLAIHRMHREESSAPSGPNELQPQSIATLLNEYVESPISPVAREPADRLLAAQAAMPTSYAILTC
jgi:hypothetical protein